MNRHTDFWQKEAGLVDIADKNLKLQDCLDLIIPALEPVMKSGGRVFDFGCGIGRLAVPIAKHFTSSNIFGYDVAPKFTFKAVEYAKAEGVQDRCHFMTGDDFNLKVEAAYSMLVLQHIDNEHKPAVIARIAQTLDKGGIFRFQYVEGTADTFLTHDALWSNVKKWLQAAGFKVKSVDYDVIEPRWTWVTAVKE